MPNSETFMVEGARLIWRNFAGKETAFKPAGNRSFNVILDKATADKMAADGWNVKCKPAGEPAEDDDEVIQEEFCYIEVAVGYKQRPPKIVVITETSRTSLTEDTVEMLDWADIRNADLIARAYHWEVGSGASKKTGIKAYLQSLYVTIEEDELDRKYAIVEGE